MCVAAWVLLGWYDASVFSLLFSQPLLILLKLCWYCFIYHFHFSGCQVFLAELIWITGGYFTLFRPVYACIANLLHYKLRCTQSGSNLLAFCLNWLITLARRVDVCLATIKRLFSKPGFFWQWNLQWEWGHPEQQILERRKWSYSKWGNHFTDSLAGRMWGGDPTQYQSNPCAPIMLHAQSLQVQLSDGTISGKIKQNLPPIINTNIGLQQLARYIHYSKEQMTIIDWANYHIFQIIYIYSIIQSTCMQKLEQPMVYMLLERQ